MYLYLGRTPWSETKRVQDMKIRYAVREAKSNNHNHLQGYSCRSPIFIHLIHLIYRCTCRDEDVQLHPWIKFRGLCEFSASMYCPESVCLSSLWEIMQIGCRFRTLQWLVCDFQMYLWIVELVRFSAEISALGHWGYLVWVWVWVSDWWDWCHSQSWTLGGSLAFWFVLMSLLLLSFVFIIW